MQAYIDTLKYLESLTNYELTGLDPAGKEFDLGKLRKVLEEAGNPHRSFRSIHVAGTKGKGSICSFASSILKEAGYKVGLFTSPHLVNVRERIKVNGEAISKADFSSVINRLKEHAGQSNPKEFTFFELLTLAAILYFSEKKVDYAVFEVGLGGRLDATNIIDAEICGISPISYDHTNILGGTIEAITGEKAAIIKRGARCVSSPQRDAALSILKDKCLQEEAPLSLVGKDITLGITRLERDGSSFNVRGKKRRYKDCRINMPGHFQPVNCATAIGICEELLTSEGLTEGAVKKGIESAFLPGRLEIISREPLIVIDGAQNEESAQCLKESIERIFRRKRLVLILGLSKDKDIKGVCRQLTSLADEVILTKASVERAADPLLVRGYIKGKPAKVTRDTKEALGIAFSKAGKDDMILATGSFYVIAEIRKLIGCHSRERGNP
jgi:dihydrofolate synthase/folylpolyglutamate synthase